MTARPAIPSVVLAAPTGPPIASEPSAWLAFDRPSEIIRAYEPAEVPSCLDAIADAGARGLWCAGYLSYEAATGFDPALKTHRPDGAVLWFGVFERPRAFRLEEVDLRPFHAGPWKPDLDRDAYAAKIETIHDLIEAGETYQANFTWQLGSAFEGDAWSLFRALHGAQPTAHSAWVETPSKAVCCASPELFFERSGRHLRCRPMKGTAAASGDPTVDQDRAVHLLGSSKNRAENLMIVDMVRNDLGRVATPGSVHCSRLFDIEHHPTVLQMTSTIEGSSDRPTTEVLAALFPSASITGAPKVRTMELLHDLEVGPRGVYTGSIGWIAPNGDAAFNVAIRTAVVDKQAGTVSYGTGGGIVWDSRPEDEYAECLTKARILDTLIQPT